MATVEASKATLASLISAQTQARKAANQLYVQLHAYVEAVFGKGAPQLTTFGFGTGTRKPQSPATKVLAAAKAKRTRAVRGPTGKARTQVTVDGSPGLTLVAPTGEAIPGVVTQGPIAPAQPKLAEPATVSTTVATPGASTPGQSSK